mgnify:CR=1 FL=1
MTLFVDKQKITGKETEQLFSAGISLLLSKAIRLLIHASTVFLMKISVCYTTRHCVAHGKVA